MNGLIGTATGSSPRYHGLHRPALLHALPQLDLCFCLWLMVRSDSPDVDPFHHCSILADANGAVVMDFSDDMGSISFASEFALDARSGHRHEVPHLVGVINSGRVLSSVVPIDSLLSLVTDGFPVSLELHW